MADIGYNIGFNLGYDLSDNIAKNFEFTDYLTFANATARYVINPASSVVSGPFAGGTPAITFISGKPFIQIEASAQNQLEHSQDPVSYEYVSGLATYTTNDQTDPLGGLTAGTLTEDTSNGLHATLPDGPTGVSMTSGNVRCFSLFAKNIDRGYVSLHVNQTGVGTTRVQVTIDLTTGTVTSQPVGTDYTLSYGSQYVGNGWWRVWVTYTVWVTASIQEWTMLSNTNGTSPYPSYTGAGKKIAVWQGDSIISRYPQSPIKTTTAAVTRNKDQAYISAALVPALLKDKSKWTFRPTWSSSQVTTGDEREICEFEDTIGNIRCYYDGADKKIKVAGRNKNWKNLLDTWGLYIYGSNIYYTTYTPRQIYTVPVAGGTETLIKTADSGGYVLGIITDGSYIYYAYSGGTPNGIHRCDMNGANDTILTSSVATPTTLALTATKLYWADYGSGKIKSYTLVGGAVTDEVTGLVNPCGVAVDATNLYYSSSVAIYYIPLAGGSPTTIISGLTSVRTIWVEGTIVYWSTQAGGIYSTRIATGTPVTTITTGMGTDMCQMSILNSNVWIAERTGTIGIKTVFKAPFYSGATTHSANQELSVTLDRVNGMATLAGFSTGNGVVTGTPWNRANGILRIGMDSSEANQIDGLIRLEKAA